MSEIKNSIKLETIIDYAKQSVLQQKYSLTAEGFLIAIINIAFFGEKINGIDDSDVREICKILSDAGINAEQVKNGFCSYYDNHTPQMLDYAIMQSIIADTKKNLEVKGENELTIGGLLSALLKKPTPAIKSYLLENQASNNSNPNTDNPFSAFYKIKPKSNGTFEIPKVRIPSTEKPKDESPKEPEKDPVSTIIDLAKKVAEARGILQSKIMGQNNAIDVFLSGYFQSQIVALTDKNRTRPSATFLFAGPPGVGKTYLAEIVGKEILGLPFKRFDMSEYCDHEAALEFIGSDNVFKGSSKGNFTGFVEENPKCVLLFDEIEKAYISIIHLFLQILDAGIIRDSNTDKTLSLKDAIIIFTTNAGRELYENSETADYSGVPKRVIIKALENDINPITKEPFFPAAICSRFATGNVVMFNHLNPYHLSEIARKEVVRRSEDFTSTTGVEIDIDKRVYSALLFSEGGKADARSIKGRTGTFFDSEVFELFRLISSGRMADKLKDLKKINIGVDMNYCSDKVKPLFEPAKKLNILAFGSQKAIDAVNSIQGNFNVISADSVESGEDVLKNNDICVILLDVGYGMDPGDLDLLNIEDKESIARDFFKVLKARYSEYPLYLLQIPDVSITQEEKSSLTRMGIRDIIKIDGNNVKLAEIISNICDEIYTQSSMTFLASTNKIVTYETAQSFDAASGVATVEMFDFDLDVAVEGSDSGKVLSDISKPNVRFKDVIGAENAKKELEFFVSYLRNPKNYLGMGIKAPKGAILYGPPGTGKTMLAKAMACESDVTFIATEGNRFFNKYVGESQKSVHEIFKTARKYAPAIIFIDEMDSIAMNRENIHENDTIRKDVINSFLAEMDGFVSDPKKPVFVLGATNFDAKPGSKKSLDPAFMRRFDSKIYVDLPDREDRKKYLELKIKKYNMFDISEAQIDNIAMRSAGMSLAELELVIEFALRTYVREKRSVIDDDALEEAFEESNGGEEKKWSRESLEKTARHEAGHAYVAWKNGDKPSYVTIVARGNHGGYMQHGDNEDKGSYTKDELLGLIRTSLAGRAAELEYYGEKDGITTGPSADLEHATNLARRIVCSYGMEKEFGMGVVDSVELNGGEVSLEIRRIVNSILDEQMIKTRETIANGRKAIDALVSTLMQKNHLNGNEIDQILTANS